MQEIVVAFAVASAVLYLGFVGYRAVKGHSSGSCGSCSRGCGSPTSSVDGFVDVEDLRTIDEHFSA